MFDAGALARVYIKDIGSTNLRAIFDQFGGAIHAPSLAAAEITSAWLAKVPTELSWDAYEGYLNQFTADASEPEQRIQLWSIDELLLGALQVIREAAELNLAKRAPRIGAHDAYYVSLVRWLADRGARTILVTNDRQLWMVARELGHEVFHGNTCDLGAINQRNVGLVGAHFPENKACQPCALQTCSSTFVVDLMALPPNLDSGTPRTKSEIEGS